jgi:hypothetical protein
LTLECPVYIFFDGINLSIVYLSFFKLFQRSLHQSTPPHLPGQPLVHKKPTFTQKKLLTPFLPVSEGRVA